MKYGNFTVLAGDRVTIRDRFGALRTGIAQPLLLSPTHCVLNMGGRYGTPLVANADNIVRVSHRSK
jgi:hypothetical protein